jgi:hypothetical protein
MVFTLPNIGLEFTFTRPFGCNSAEATGIAARFTCLAIIAGCVILATQALQPPLNAAITWDSALLHTKSTSSNE